MLHQIFVSSTKKFSEFYPMEFRFSRFNFNRLHHQRQAFYYSKQKSKVTSLLNFKVAKGLKNFFSHFDENLRIVIRRCLKFSDETQQKIKLFHFHHFLVPRIENCVKFIYVSYKTAPNVIKFFKFNNSLLAIIRC